MWGMSEADEEQPEATSTSGRPVIKRRWAIVRKAGGGAALLAVAGTIALADPTEQSDPGQGSGGGDSQISAEA